jgi:putative transcriptional regulator
MGDIHDKIKIKTNNLKPARGRILISEPFLVDYFFKRSVVLLAEHNDEGTFGVILNKPVRAKFNDVVKDFPFFETRLYLGGPVQGDSLFFIHTLGDEIPESSEVLDGIFWGGDIEMIREMIAVGKITSDQIRFYIGYSGWAPQQLDDELKRNSWVVSHINAEQILKTKPKLMWDKALRQLGGDYSLWTNFPDDPTSN